ncbi:hypothetical protein P3T21_004848 [Paraburkholderia sp. GAS334]
MLIGKFCLQHLKISKKIPLYCIALTKLKLGQMNQVKRRDQNNGIVSSISAMTEPVHTVSGSRVPRRKFLAGLLAGAGSVALSACGGGGGSDGAGSNSAAAPGVRGQSAAAESANGTRLPPATSIVDSAQNQWTIGGDAVVLRNGVNTGCNIRPTWLVYLNHVVYAQDASNTWSVYSQGGWAITPDPTTVAAAATSTKLFYGMNGHMAWTSTAYQTISPAQQVAILQDLGVTNYRADVADAGMAQTVANALKGAFAGTGISILPCINVWNTYNQHASESDAYNLGHQLAVSIATPLKGLVKYIECGNELDSNGLIHGGGNLATDYDPAIWPAFRGVLRGLIDGVKSVDPTIQCGVNVGVPLAYEALQMLWNGVQPNGTSTGQSGATPLRWDVTMFHWYESSGDIRRAGSQGLTDVLQILRDSFSLPIWLTEWGYQLSDDAATQATYVTTTLNEYYTMRSTYNLQSVMMYQLFDTGTDTYGLLAADGTTRKACYASFKNFVAANPV